MPTLKNCTGIFRINRTDGVLRSFPKGLCSMPNSIYITWQEESAAPTPLGFEPLVLADCWSKVVLHVEWGLKFSLDEVFSFTKVSTFSWCVSQQFWLWSCCLLPNIVKTSQVFRISPFFHCSNGMNTLIFVLRILFQLWCSDKIFFFHFSQVIYSLCSVSMTAIRKWERSTAWWWWHWHGTNVTSDFLVNPYSKCCPSWLRMSDCSASDSFDPSSRSKLFWIMTYSIFPTWNVFYKMSRKTLFQLSCISSSP